MDIKVSIGDNTSMFTCNAKFRYNHAEKSYTSSVVKLIPHRNKNEASSCHLDISDNEEHSSLSVRHYKPSTITADDPPPALQILATPT